MRPSCRARKGTTLVESAVVSLTCLLFVLAIFEYGRFLLIRQTLDNACREGCRQATSGTSNYTTANIQQTVLHYLVGQPLLNSQGQTLGTSDISVFRADPATGQPSSTDSVWTDAAFGDYIGVQATAIYKPMLALGFMPASIQMQATVVMQSEAN